MRKFSKFISESIVEDITEDKVIEYFQEFLDVLFNDKVKFLKSKLSKTADLFISGQFEIDNKITPSVSNFFAEVNAHIVLKNCLSRIIKDGFEVKSLMMGLEGKRHIYQISFNIESLYPKKSKSIDLYDLNVFCDKSPGSSICVLYFENVWKCSPIKTITSHEKKSMIEITGESDVAAFDISNIIGAGDPISNYKLLRVGHPWGKEKPMLQEIIDEYDFIKIGDSGNILVNDFCNNPLYFRDKQIISISTFEKEIGSQKEYSDLLSDLINNETDDYRPTHKYQSDTPILICG